MPWEYLENKTYRYDLVRRHTRNLGHVVELCNGAGTLKEHLDCKSYSGCDKAKGIYDDKFVLTLDECDTLIALGHGGFEIDHSPLESATLTQSILYVIRKFKPKTLILESVNKYQSIIDDIIKDTDYIGTYNHKADGDRWTDKRTLRIFANQSAMPLTNLWIDVKIPYEPGNKLAEAYNRAMESTTAEWVLLLDHDLFICNPHWYEMCLNAIKQLEGQKVGWITAKCNRVACWRQKHQTSTDNNDIEHHIAIAKSLYKEKGNELIQTDADFSGFFILTNKTAWKICGGFLDVGKGLLGIDNDYRRRLSEAGFNLYVMNSLYFYHLYKQKIILFKGF